MLKSVLQKIGLTDKDAEVYLACLEMGTQPASVIAKKAGLKRPTTYLILEALVKRGLVSEYTGTSVKFFTAVSPDYLLNYIEKQKRDLTQHQRELQEYLPQLHSLSNPYSLNPKVRFYEGLEGVERVMNDTLTSKEPIRCFTSLDCWFLRKETRDYILWYGKERVRHYKIPERAIANDTPANRKYLEEEYPDIEEDRTYSQFRWLPSDVGLFQNEINIYENKVAIVSIGKKELLGMIIESESITETQKAIFEVSWRAAEQSKWEKLMLQNLKQHNLRQQKNLLERMTTIKNQVAEDKTAEQK